jgi:hypothetical protein
MFHEITLVSGGNAEISPRNRRRDCTVYKSSITLLRIQSQRVVRGFGLSANEIGLESANE